MITGFERIVEERILTGQRNGVFSNLPGCGKPIAYNDDQHIAEDLRLAFKILKNAECVPPEIELKKEIQRVECLLEAMTDEAKKYQAIKKLNFLILKLNSLRNTAIVFDMPQKYMEKLTERIEGKRGGHEKEYIHEKRL